MEIVQYNESTFYTYERNGNDRNGNPIYKVNIFEKWYNVRTNDEGFERLNACTGRTLDKGGNIRLQSYNIKVDVQRIIALRL